MNIVFIILGILLLVGVIIVCGFYFSSGGDGAKWNLLAVVLLLLSISGLIVLISELVSFCKGDNSDAPTELITRAEIQDLTVGYLTDVDYNNGDYSDSSIMLYGDFSVGITSYTIVDFTIKTLEENDGSGGVKLSVRPLDTFAVSMMIQEAPTGKVETIRNEDGSYAYDLFYTVLADKGDEKHVRMILKLVPNQSGDIALEIMLQGVNGTQLAEDVEKSLVLHVKP